MRTLLQVILLLLFTSTTHGQTTVSGTVTDFRYGSPLIGVHIVYQHNEGIGTQTNFEGHFTLAIPVDTDSLIFSYIGYESQTVKVDTLLGIRMRTSKQAIAEVVVKAHRVAASEFATERLTALDIYLNPASKADPLLAVDALPASTNTEETANVSLRGSAPAETGVFLNNVPLDDMVRFDQIDGVGQFSIFNTALLSQLQLYPSNPPVEFGQSTSGIVALYTRNEVPRNQNQLSLNLVGISGMLSRKINVRTGITAYVNTNSDRGMRLLNPKAFPNLLNFESVDGGLHFVHRLSPATHLQVFNFSLFEKYRYRIQEPSFDGVFDQKKRRNLTVINLTHKRKNSRFEWNQSYNITQSEYQFGNIQVMPKNFNTFQGLQASVFDDNWSIKSGFAARWGRYQSVGTFPLIDYAYQEQHPSQAFTSKENFWLPEAYVYGKYHFSDQLVLGSGIRYRFPSQNVQGFLSAQASLNYQPHEQHLFNLALGRYSKRLAPNASIPVDEFRSKQISLDYRFQVERWTLQSALYSKWNTMNSINNTIYGAELSISYKGDQLTANASLSTVESNLKENNIEYPSPHDMSYFLRATVQYDIPKWFIISATYRQRQGRYFLPVDFARYDPQFNLYEPFFVTPDEGLRFPTYQRCDLSISKLIPVDFGSVLIYASVNNLFDHDNVSRNVYNFDYSHSSPEYFSRRVVFFGGLLMW